MAWYDEAIFYHIYPIGMLGAPRSNDYSGTEHRLRELEDYIGHIKEIGCNAIYIGPLFESRTHGYDTTDYKKLDSRLGDNEDLKKFVADCHEAGIKVVFDGVFNHVGRDFFAFKDLQANREGSAYRDWFCNVNFGGNNEFNDGFSYDNWGGVNILVKLNQRNPAVKDYIAGVIQFWVDEFDVDGIRLDAADVLDFDFMKSLRVLADHIKPEFWLMGEVIHGDYTRWVNEGTLHCVTNYVLHKALFSGHNDHNYFEIAHTVNRLVDMGANRPDGLKLYNFTDNHDVDRIISKLNNRANYFPVHVLEYTLPGIPSIYYGSELAIEGKIEGRRDENSDAILRPRLSYDDVKDSMTTNQYTKLIARLGQIRQENKVLSHGEYKQLVLTNRQYVFSRNTSDATAIIAVNNDESEATVAGGGARDGQYIGLLSGKTLTVSGTGFNVTIPANSGEIYILQGNQTVEPEPIPEPVTIEPVKEPEPVPAAEPTPVAEPEPVQEQERTVRQVSPKVPSGGAAAKYGLAEKYASIEPTDIAARNDYESMTMEELQVAILEKMAHNGPVNEQMVKTVMDNVYMDSLKNWVRSFN